MDHTWDDALITEARLGSGSNRFPMLEVCVYAPDARATAFTMHLCYLSRLSGNGRKFTVGPRWRTMVEQHAQSIEERVD